MGRWGKVEQTPSVLCSAGLCRHCCATAVKGGASEAASSLPPLPPRWRAISLEPCLAAHRPLRPSRRGLPEFPTPVQPAREARTAGTARAGQRGPGPAVTGGYPVPALRVRPAVTAARATRTPSGAIAAPMRLSRTHAAALSFSPQWLPSPTAACAEGLTKAPKLQGKRGARRARPFLWHGSL